MVEMRGVYQGDFRCELSHGPSGTKISTDAPRDNMGKGESFSPTDLMGAALGSCILTTMAIVAKKEGIAFERGSFQVGKEMVSHPRRIGTLSVSLRLPRETSPEERKKLEEIAVTCPAYRSLNPEIQIPVTFDWSL